MSATASSPEHSRRTDGCSRWAWPTRSSGASGSRLPSLSPNRRAGTRTPCGGTARRWPRPIVRPSGCRCSMSQPMPFSTTTPSRMGCTKTRADESRSGPSRRPAGPASPSSFASRRAKMRALSCRGGAGDRASAGPTTPRSPKGGPSRIRRWRPKRAAMARCYGSTTACSTPRSPSFCLSRWRSAQAPRRS